MRVLATGASGFLGSHLVQAAQDRKYEVLGTRHRNRSNPSYLALDLNDSGAVGRALQDFKPDVLIHTAAQANTAFVERKPQLSHKVNVLTTENLAKCCKEQSVAIIFISTSYVFSGKNVPPGGYTTSDPTDPTMTYGCQKVEAERRVLAAGPSGKTAVLRIPLLYSLDSDSPKHWLSELLGQLEQGETVLVDDCAQRRPSPVQDVCRVILDLCERYGQQEALPPILHFSCQIACTKLELLSKAAQKRGLPINIIQPFVHADDGVERPLIEHLSNATLEKIGIDVSCTAA